MEGVLSRQGATYKYWPCMKILRYVLWAVSSYSDEAGQRCRFHLFASPLLPSLPFWDSKRQSSVSIHPEYELSLRLLCSRVKNCEGSGDRSTSIFTISRGAACQKWYVGFESLVQSPPTVPIAEPASCVTLHMLSVRMLTSDFMNVATTGLQWFPFMGSNLCL